MRIRCQHGYFSFYEYRAGDISRFMSLYGFDLVPVEDYFTFAALEDAPHFSVAGAAYLGLTATATYEGKPWEIMQENDLIYNFSLGEVVNILSVTQLVQISISGHYFIANGLIMPGSITADGTRVKDYSAWFNFDTLKFRYSEITNE